MASGGDNGGKTKKTVAIIAVSSILLVAVAMAVAFGVRHNNMNKAASSRSDVSQTTKAIVALCNATDYKEICQQRMAAAAGNATDPIELTKIGFKVARDELYAALRNSSTLKDLAKEPRTNQALENCYELIEYAIDDLSDSFNAIGEFEVSKLGAYVDDLKIWLSGSIAYEETCLDGFENTTGPAGDRMREILTASQHLTKNALAMVCEISNLLTSLNVGQHRRLLSGEFPTWVDERRRRLLQAPISDIVPDLIVAKDGSGNFTTITEALEAAPKKSNETFVIYVKKGIYKEYVTVEKHMSWITMIGDGPTNTKVTGRRCSGEDSYTTFNSSTFAVVGPNFIAKNMGFENSAGAIKHQAVAVRSQSDMSIFYNCQMDGYQDTLYVHSHRQFYRDCTISGTIDFIFGDAAALFQNCKMIVRKPLPHQGCMVTAQGRTDVREPTGIVLQNCTISAAPEYIPVMNVNKAYLGRPWKNFSRTIIMQSQIDELIQPTGWSVWNESNFGLDTCHYGEFNNRGPGADQSKRVTWLGIKKLALPDVMEFTAARFITGDDWIPATGVPYVSGLM